MTATAFVTEPQVPHHPAPSRPELWLVHDGCEGHDAPVRTPDPAVVEMYRRRRFFAALALTLVVIVATQLAGISLLSFDPLSAPTDTPAPAVHVVRPGDTYAAIAATLGAEHPDVAATELRAANGGAELVVGQRLMVDLERLG